MPDDLGGYLIDRPEVACNSDEMIALSRYATGAAILWLALPLVFGVLVLLEVQPFRRALSFTYSDFSLHRSPLFSAWGCIMLFRSGILTGVSLGFMGLSDPRTQCL